MAIFKRFEVWMLLLIIVGAVWFVMQPPPSEDEEEPPEEKVAVEKTVEKKTAPEIAANTPPVEKKAPEPEPEKTESPKPSSSDRFEIRKADLVEENGGTVIEISLIGQGKESLELTDSNTRLLTESGDQIDRFFLPFDPLPVVGERGSPADLKYWVQGKWESEKLWLEIDGERVAVDLAKK